MNEVETVKGQNCLASVRRWLHPQQSTKYKSTEVQSPTPSLHGSVLTHITILTCIPGHEHMHMPQACDSHTHTQEEKIHLSMQLLTVVSTDQPKCTTGPSRPSWGRKYSHCPPNLLPKAS